ncbi:hypothetical protein O9929_25845 [Vibrio lentus]|nr:hypothetical protein [Vibrio lentus]
MTINAVLLGGFLFKADSEIIDISIIKVMIICTMIAWHVLVDTGY